MDVRWRIEMLGGLRAVQGDRVLTRFRTQKTGALLAYLAYHLDRSHPRDQLIECFWPDGGLPAGRNNLSRELSWLRDQLEPAALPAGSVIAADRTSVRLNPSVITTDVAAFEAALRAAERAANPAERRRSLVGAIEAYRGELLPGYFDGWILQEREWLAERYCQALSELLAHLEQAGEFARALEYARGGVRADRLREEAHRDLMRLLAAAGQPEAALRQYRELERLLKQELEAEPSAATQALARQIEAGQGARPEQPTPTMAPTPNLPEGTVIFLFTDIGGSTQLWEQHPDAMRLALARHDALLRAAIEAHDGHVFKALGDAFYAAFSTAPQALAAALASQRALQAEPWGEVGSLRVRMALHTGVAELRDGDYFGPALNRVARLLTAAHGGQILLSQATYHLVRDGLPEDASLRDLGAHRLKDLQQPEHLFQLLHPALPADFPPLHSLEAFAHNLPRQLTSFIGREREMREVKEFLATTWLLTLTGSGGCGKTRLALQVAADLLEAYADGVWLVELAALADPTLVPQTVASPLGVREEPGRPLTATLTDYLRPKQVLLILDNCEHLLTACAQLVEGLLRGCPKLRILASSREGLGIGGEQTYRVPSLSLPDARHLPPLERLHEFEAVQLFADRARLSQATFSITPANAPAVVQVCERLDGIPLAIELAAARVKALPVEKLNERLDDMFRLLTGGSRTALPRQQTLRALIDWSYDLLSEVERALLRRVSAFAGGWTLEAAEAVCVGEAVEEGEVLDLLTSLVEKSLVLYEEGEGEGRYRLLETVRQYARDRLLEAGEAAAVRSRHRDWFLALAEEAEQGLVEASQTMWLDRLEREHDNLRAALAWTVVEGQGEAGLRLGGTLMPFWVVRGYLAEGREHLGRVLTLPGAEARTAARAKALYSAAALACLLGEYEAARALLEESRAIFRELGEKGGIASSLHPLGDLARDQGDYGRARALLEETLAIWRELGDKRGIAFSLMGLGRAAQEQGEYGAARALLEESLAISRELGNKGGIASSLHSLGTLARDQAECGRARALVEESLAIWREGGYKLAVGWSLNSLGLTVRDQRDYGRARALLEESLAIFRELGNKRGIAWDLEGLATVAMVQGEPERAARLFGPAEGLREEIGNPLPTADRAEHDRFVAAVRAALGEEAFAAAWAAGRAMSLEQAVAFALAE
jgi:predicted ATPase/class 3 adenylate cyclase